MSSNQKCFSYNKYLQPAEKDKPEINLKQSPLALLAQTCSAIESNLYSDSKQRVLIPNSYKVLNKQQKIEDVAQLKPSKDKCYPFQQTSSRKHDIPNKAPRVEKVDKKVIKRSSSSCSSVKMTPSPKKQKLNQAKTPVINVKRESSENFSSPNNLNHLVPQSNKQNENLLKQAQLQMQMMNPMHYYMKTIEDQLKSSQHVCNWMVNNVTCGKKFSTSDQLLSHLQTHAMTSQPSYPPISSLQTNQMLQSAYSILQNHQNQLASVNFAGQNNLSGVPVFNPFAKYLHGNLPMLPTSATTVSPYCLPFSNVFS